jgi:hypothetical protein
VRVPLIVGPSLIAVAFALLTRLTATSVYVDVLIPLLILALGIGVTFVPLTISAVAGVRREDSGLPASLLNTCQQVGGAIGLAVLSTISATATRHRLAEPIHGGQISQHLVKTATVYGYTRAFTVAAGLAGLAVLIVVLGIRTSRRKHTDETAISATAWGCGGPAGASTLVAGTRELVRMKSYDRRASPHDRATT